MVTKSGDAAADDSPLVHSSCNGAAALGLMGSTHADQSHEELPSSALACEELTCVLIDMGLARRASDRATDHEDHGIDTASVSSSSGLTTADAQSVMRRVATPAFSAIGSPGFMAPEQIRDARTAGHAADVCKAARHSNTRGCPASLRPRARFARMACSTAEYLRFSPSQTASAPHGMRR